MLYLDVQNVFNYKAQQPDILLCRQMTPVLPCESCGYGAVPLKFIKADAGTILQL